MQVRAADRDRLEAFLEVTGFGVALDSIALAAGDAPAMLGMQTGDFGSDWSRVSQQVFDTEKMQEMALDILSETLSDEHLSHAAEFYASPLGQRLVEAENASHMVEDDEAKQQEGRALVAEAVEQGDERVETLQNLNEAVDSDGNSVRAVQEIQVRFLMAASNAGILEQDLDEGALRAAMKAGEDEMRQAMRASALAGAAYTYQNFSNDELQAYLEALEHPDMQTVYQLMNAVQYEIMANRFEVLAARMAEMHPGQEL
ncbi:DUF2059 domain-containing protein [Roseovarius atlanticus]|uniref:DUF2059 domain-containing protein n=1 Tax=Roseovarius atlanticus TaxID=1641875 RepID=UPI001C94749E|nr:DUF2059 domain-containing protein [Roseovarius atlanticus]MBY5988622.1 DUF2059 domain-containing protein [Roseovarius atlanticus]MBY6124012.1 DUF2059 domain-containing protein [Roseovarius atlanticus]MBY6148507.1 DUF2059 domain-containing protein [Roseovarius atlanticus]